jgi:cytochrome c biogenesis protein CcmG/thiol:disulfide interchange protein DsbE
LSAVQGAPGAAPRTRFRRALWISAAAGLLVVALVAVLATRPPAQDAAAQSPLLGKPAPPIIGTSFDGAPVSLATMRGEFVLVNFFASWCPPCREEQPELVEFAYDHKGSGDATVLGVAFDDDPSSASRFLRSTGAVWPAVPDPGGRIALAYGVSAPPESYLVAPDGRVVAKVVGGLTAASLNSLVARARSEHA